MFTCLISAPASLKLLLPRNLWKVQKTGEMWTRQKTYTHTNLDSADVYRRRNHKAGKWHFARIERVFLRCFLLAFLLSWTFLLKSVLSWNNIPLQYQRSSLDSNISSWDNGYSNNEECEIPGLIHDGVPWPNCEYQIAFLAAFWNLDSCFANHGVTGSLCSIVKYLSQTERSCPVTEYSDIKIDSLFYKGQLAEVRTNLDGVYAILGNEVDYKWMADRIHAMEKMWIRAAEDVFSSQKYRRKKKRIHLHLGVMKTDYGKNAYHGAPLGELVQWSDLLASLHIMGHDVVVTRNSTELDRIYQQYISNKSGACPTKTSHEGPNIPFDIIYTDIMGYKRDISVMLQGSLLNQLKCRFRIVDSFGTEAEFNDAEYGAYREVKEHSYGGLGLDLRQFNTMFPHSPDNTFLGFVIEKITSEEEHKERPEDKRKIALIYGKSKNIDKEKRKLFSVLHEYFPVHATMNARLPHFVKNHKVLPPSKFFELLSRTKVFVGLGKPPEGPAPLEAIQHGAVFLNPTEANEEIMSKKPTYRKLTSQNPYAESIGKPHVYTVDMRNEEDLRAALQEIASMPDPGAYLPYEFSVKGTLERIAVQVEKQQFCVRVPYIAPANVKTIENPWPPLSTLVAALSAVAKQQSCNEVCSELGLICEPSFFPILNREGAFGLPGIGRNCRNLVAPATAELDYPAYDENSSTCYLQTNPRLFSCSGNYLNLRRLCPCRDFIRGQKALCKDCGLT